MLDGVPEVGDRSYLSSIILVIFSPYGPKNDF